MAIVTVTKASERALAQLTNVTYDLDGNLFLTPDNILAGDGDPRVFDSGIPEYEDGVNVYGGTTPQDLIKQNPTLIPFSKHNYVWATYETDGLAAPEPSNTDTEIQTPSKPGLKAVASTTGGYKAGTYQAAYSGADTAGNSTLISPTNTVTLTTNGQNITFEFPTIPSSWPGVYLWLSDTDDTSAGATMWQQAWVDLTRSRPDTIELTGPLTKKISNPTVNETFLGQTDQPYVGRVSSNYLLYPGDYYVYANEVTLAGESIASAQFTTPHTETTTSYHALKVWPQNLDSASIGWRCYIKGKDGRTYVVYPAGLSPATILSKDDRPKIYSTDSSQWPTDSAGNPVDWQITQADLPTTDTSGLDDPIDAPDQPTATGGLGLDAATYYVALTATKNGIEGPRGAAASINVTSGKSVKVNIPKNVQKISNPDQNESNTDFSPVDYAITTNNGTVTYSAGQTHITVTSGNSGASNKPKMTTSPVAIGTTERTYDWRMHAEITIDSYTTGSPLVVLQEYSTPDCSSGLLKETPLVFQSLSGGSTNVNMTGVGSEEVDWTIHSTDNFWQTNTQGACLQLRFWNGSTGTLTNNTAAFSMTVENFYFSPHAHLHDKAKKGNRQKQEPDDPNVPSYTATFDGPDFQPRKPRKRKKPQANRGKPVPDRPTMPQQSIKTYDFETGSIPSGLTVSKSTVDSNHVAAVNTTAAITGTYGIQFQDLSTTGTSYVYASETLAGSTTRVSLGVKLSMKIAGLPASGREVRVFRLRDASGNSLGGYNLVSNGTTASLYFHAYDLSGEVQSDLVATGLAINQVVILELVAQGAGTTDGHLRGFFQLGTGGTNQIASDAEDLNWNLRYAAAYDFGVVAETTTNSPTNLYFDDVTITEIGTTYYRERGPQGEVIYQGYFMLPRGTAIQQDVFPHNLRVAVKPNTTYATGMYLRAVGLKGTQYPFYITLHTTDGGIIDVGSIVGPTGITGTQWWADYVKVFTTPDNCYELRVNGHDIQQGKYVVQELCLSEADDTDLAFLADTTTDTLTAGGHGLANGQLVQVRNDGGALPQPLAQFAYYWVVNATTDSLQLSTLPGGLPVNLTTTGSGTSYLVRSMPKRTGLRAASGSFRQTLDTYSPNAPAFAEARGPFIPRQWKSAGVTVIEQPAATDIAVTYRSSHDRIGYTDSFADVANVPFDRYLEVYGVLTGDGINSVKVPPGSPFLLQELGVATLLREDGTEFDGGTILLDYQGPANMPQVDVRQLLNGHVIRHPLAAPVGEVAGFKVQLFTEAARREILETWLTKLFRVEGRGKSVVIKPKKPITLSQVGHTQQHVVLDGQRYYYIYATGDAGEVEIMEEGNL